MSQAATRLEYPDPYVSDQGKIYTRIPNFLRDSKPSG
jgi:hypothetical protein